MFEALDRASAERDTSGGGTIRKRTKCGEANSAALLFDQQVVRKQQVVHQNYPLDPHKPDGVSFALRFYPSSAMEGLLDHRSPRSIVWPGPTMERSAPPTPSSRQTALPSRNR